MIFRSVNPLPQNMISKRRKFTILFRENRLIWILMGRNKKTIIGWLGEFCQNPEEHKLIIFKNLSTKKSLLLEEKFLQWNFHKNVERCRRKYVWRSILMISALSGSENVCECCVHLWLRKDVRWPRRGFARYIFFARLFFLLCGRSIQTSNKHDETHLKKHSESFAGSAVVVGERVISLCHLTRIARSFMIISASHCTSLLVFRNI